MNDRSIIECMLIYSDDAATLLHQFQRQLLLRTNRTRSTMPLAASPHNALQVQINGLRLQAQELYESTLYRGDRRPCRDPPSHCQPQLVHLPQSKALYVRFRPDAVEAAASVPVSVTIQDISRAFLSVTLPDRYVCGLNVCLCSNFWPSHFQLFRTSVEINASDAGCRRILCCPGVRGVPLLNRVSMVDSRHDIWLARLA